MNQDKNKLKALRHSAEHVLMQAIDELYPGKVIKAMGPATETGFYYDFETKNGFKITDQDFEKIEKQMKKIVEKDLPIIKKEISIKAARRLFADNPYKQEWLDEIEKNNQKVTVYYTGDPNQDSNKVFVDLCSGPHVSSTGKIGAFKLLSVAGAYWRGDEKNKMLTRIYGTAFFDKKSLDDYLNLLEEAEKRDHRRIGKQLDLFSFHPEAPGDVFWHHNGYIIFKELVEYWRQIHQREGYQEVRTHELLTKQSCYSG